MLKRTLSFCAIALVAVAAYAAAIANLPGLTPALDSRVPGMNQATGNEGAFQVDELLDLATTDVSFTVTATGLTDTVTATATATVIDNVVILNVPAIGGTSNTSTFTLTGLPASITPATTRTVIVSAIDNGGTEAIGKATISTAGVIALHPLPSISSTFTDTGAKSITALSVSYTQ